MKINFQNILFGLRGIGVIVAILAVSSCGRNDDTESVPDAYSAGAKETHLVVAAPLEEKDGTQRLWVCKGTKVQDGTPADGYLVSIGTGKGAYSDPDAQTTANRGNINSNLTPVGELFISRMLPYSCQAGMLSRCMQLSGVEKNINKSTIYRGIYIHGTSKANYDDLGESASHGCVRMTTQDVTQVYKRVKKGTRVWINSAGLPRNQNPCNFTGKAR